jgi:hypothetical protein
MEPQGILFNTPLRGAPRTQWNIDCLGVHRNQALGCIGAGSASNPEALGVLAVPLILRVLCVLRGETSVSSSPSRDGKQPCSQEQLLGRGIVAVLRPAARQGPPYKEHEEREPEDNLESHPDHWESCLKPSLRYRCRAATLCHVP